MDKVPVRPGLPQTAIAVFILLTVQSTVSLSQQFPKIVWIGRVTSVEQQSIHASSGPQGTLTNLTIKLASGGKVWKKRTRNDFSAIRVGDEISVVGYRVALGELAATEIWANITRFSGQIINVKGNEYQVREYRTGQTRTAVVDSETVSGARNMRLSPSDLQVGRDIETIGLLLPDGKVAASRIYIWVNGLPLGVKNPRFIDPRNPPPPPPRRR
jgi:hypothetical protein